MGYPNSEGRFEIPTGAKVYMAPVGASLDGYTSDGTPVTLSEEGVTLWSQMGLIVDE